MLLLQPTLLGSWEQFGFKIVVGLGRVIEPCRAEYGQIMLRCIYVDTLEGYKADVRVDKGLKCGVAVLPMGAATAQFPLQGKQL